MTVRVSLLGVPVDPVSVKDAIVRLISMLASERQHHVMTPNSEMLVEAFRNPLFHAVLRRSSLNLPDGVGLLLMARLTGQYLPERVTGVDTVRRLCMALPETCPVFLLGGRSGAARLASERLRDGNPHLRFAGTFEGSSSEEEAPEIIRRINDCRPAILFVAYGAPEQDLWIARHLSEMPTVQIAMGVGGAFDFLSGRKKRAPLWMRRAGFEWLYRLMREPKRLRRIWHAVIVFPWLVILSIFRSH